MNDISTYSLFINASFFVKFILFILLSASIVSWTFIVNRFLFLKQLRQQDRLFYQEFSRSDDLLALLGKQKEKIKGGRASFHGLERVFATGLREYQMLDEQQKIIAKEKCNSSERAMDIIIDKESDTMGAHLSYLATVGSVSPYVGLLGTVWGIMHSFIALGNVQQATLSMVAPGIAEALIATAVGLVAAIPAVVAYNYFNTFINNTILEYQTFQKELCLFLEHLTLVHRERHA